MKKAIITGITGQDGAWLAQILLDQGYEVYGGTRRNSHRNVNRLKQLGIENKIKFVDLELLEYSNIFSVVKSIQPDEFYNLAAQSFVGVSFQQPISTYMVDALSVGYILDILKTVSPQTKFYQASSSEMFGKVKSFPLNEESSFHPRSPYGCAKAFAHYATVNYRESYNMYCCSGILFNHESELRGPEFVTRKITLNVAQRVLGVPETLKLGNVNALRDWGWAKEYCEGMYQMMQQDKPDTYVLATGKAISVRDFVDAAFNMIDIDVAWSGEGLDEKGYDSITGEVIVKIDPEFYRPAEVDALIGDSSKARQAFGWKAKTDVVQLARRMVASDINLLRSSVQ